MVVAESERGTGIGRAVLDRAVEVAAARGAGSMWAEARSSALGFYRRAGWTVVGDEWIKPGIGPHRYIHRELRADAADESAASG
jgi:GNAT superfamily N-acetyltransferase